MTVLILLTLSNNGCSSDENPIIKQETQAAITQAHKLADAYEFSEARQTVADQRQKVERAHVSPSVYESLMAQLDEAHTSIRTKQAVFAENQRNGWTVYTGKQISPAEKQRILEDAKERQRSLREKEEAEKRRIDAIRQAQEDAEYWTLDIRPTSYFSEQFEENEVAANALLKNKWCCVNGTVESIRTDRFDNPVVALEGDVLLYFKISQSEAVGELRKEGMIVGYGKCTGRTFGKVIMSECTLIPKSQWKKYWWGKMKSKLRLKRP